MQQQQQHPLAVVAAAASAAQNVPLPNGNIVAQPPLDSVSQRLQALNEETWVKIGTLADSMGDKDRALAAFDAALRHNPFSVPALSQAASLCRQKDIYPRAIEYFQRLLNIDRYNGGVWAALGHCFLMTDDLQNAYQTYQQALNNLQNPKDPKLWYGIGVLYDRYSSYDHAEAAFVSVLRIDPKFDKGNEVYFRLGIVYKHQQKFSLSLDCFKYILTCPPAPLNEGDVWFQIGHIYESQREFQNARMSYETGLQRFPNSTKLLLQLGWLYMQSNPGFQNYDQATSYLSRASEIDANDAQAYYLLGRCYMAKQKFNQAYDFYQQSVLRDAKNAVFWCSIGILYSELGQHRDALDAYSRAIYLNSSIPVIWCNLGKLYEACNNQTADAIDAYSKAIDLDPADMATKHRLHLLRAYQAGQGPLPGPAEPAVQPNPPDPCTYVPGGGTKPATLSSSFYFPSIRTLQQQHQQYQAERRRSGVPQHPVSVQTPTGGPPPVGISRGQSPHVSHANGHPGQPRTPQQSIQYQQQQRQVSVPPPPQPYQPPHYQGHMQQQPPQPPSQLRNSVPVGTQSPRTSSQRLAVHTTVSSYQSPSSALASATNSHQPSSTHSQSVAPTNDYNAVPGSASLGSGDQRPSASPATQGPPSASAIPGTSAIKTYNASQSVNSHNGGSGDVGTTSGSSSELVSPQSATQQQQQQQQPLSAKPTSPTKQTGFVDTSSTKSDTVMGTTEDENLKREEKEEEEEEAVDVPSVAPEPVPVELRKVDDDYDDEGGDETGEKEVKGDQEMGVAELGEVMEEEEIEEEGGIARMQG